MEDALALGRVFRQVERDTKVLILVLMEDALAPSSTMRMTKIKIKS